MLIGEVVKRTGLPKDKVRFYEKMELISNPDKLRRDNNYKEYSETVVHRLLVIQELKGFGFTLNEIKDMIALYEEHLLVCSDDIPMMAEKVKLIDDKINNLKAIRNHLLNCISGCPGSCKVESTLLDLKIQPEK